jgi:hypothetical protein
MDKKGLDVRGRDKEKIEHEAAKENAVKTVYKPKPKTVYTIENTMPVEVKESFTQAEYGCKKDDVSCTISGGKKSRKSHNSKKYKKSKKSHTTYKKSKRSRR